mmetsp:Transcript_53544/g.127337  ORF Transcript_53544/g.127337 Transcript_53544/m.127337 type:complete len:223 (-) Transcript_53544:750-1418(-)
MVTFEGSTPAAAATPVMNDACLVELNSASENGRLTTISTYVSGGGATEQPSGGVPTYPEAHTQSDAFADPGGEVVVSFPEHCSHTISESAPSSSENVPAGQSEQFCGPLAFLKLPGMQGSQRPPSGPVYPRSQWHSNSPVAPASEVVEFPGHATHSRTTVGGTPSGGTGVVELRYSPSSQPYTHGGTTVVLVMLSPARSFVPNLSVRKAGSEGRQLSGGVLP